MDAASHIAHAISYPRQGLNLATQTLISLSKDTKATILSILVENLHSQRPQARLYSTIVISTIGEVVLSAISDHFFGTLTPTADLQPQMHWKSFSGAMPEEHVQCTGYTKRLSAK